MVFGVFKFTSLDEAKASPKDTCRNKFWYFFQKVCFTHNQIVKETNSVMKSQDELFICGLKNFLISPLKASTKQSQKSTGRNCWTNFKFEKGYILVLTFLSSTSFSLHEDPLMLVATFVKKNE